MVGVLATGAALEHGVFHSAAARLNVRLATEGGGESQVAIVTPGSIAESHGGSQAAIFEVSHDTSLRHVTDTSLTRH